MAINAFGTSMMVSVLSTLCPILPILFLTWSHVEWIMLTFELIDSAIGTSSMGPSSTFFAVSCSIKSTLSSSIFALWAAPGSIESLPPSSIAPLIEVTPISLLLSTANTLEMNTSLTDMLGLVAFPFALLCPMLTWVR